MGLIISHKYKFIFVHGNKTGGSSIHHYLYKFCGPHDIITVVKKWDNYISKPQNNTFLNDDGKIKEIKPHFIARKLLKVISNKQLSEYFKFGVIRNPWDRMVSFFYWEKNLKKNKGKNIDFDDFIRNSKLRTLHYYYSDKNNRLITNKLIKYENLNSDFENVCNIIGIPSVEKLNVYANSHTRLNRDYKSFYTNETKKIIEEKFMKDIKLGNYNFND